MLHEVLERIIKTKRSREPASPPSEQKPFLEILTEIGEARKNGPPVLADYQINWNLVAIGVTPKHLEKLEPTIRALAESMKPHNLGILLLVARESWQTQGLPENVRVIVSGSFTANWLRDCYFPTAKGLIEKPGRRLSPKLTPFILNQSPDLQIESYWGISFLRGGDVMTGENDVFVGGMTWSYLLDELGAEKAKESLRVFFRKENVVAVPWDLIYEEDIPIPCGDLDSYLTVLGEKIVLVGKEINLQICPNTFWFLETTARMLEENGFRVLRVPFVGRRQQTYNNVLIHGPKGLVFVPQYGEKDRLYSQAAAVYKQAGYTPIPIPFLISFSRSNFGQLRCLTFPLPSS